MKMHWAEEDEKTTMNRYLLAAPVEAVRYQRGANEQDVAQIVRGPSGRASFTTQQGFLHFYNDGPDLSVHDGDWVVRIADVALVVTDEDFTQHFVAA
jgi:hypothetical protein